MSSTKTATDDPKLIRKAWLRALTNDLKVLKGWDRKKYKRLAKSIEAFLGGHMNNDGQVLALIAGTIQLPQDTRTIHNIRASILAMWRDLDMVTSEEIRKLENDSTETQNDSDDDDQNPFALAPEL